LRTLGPDSLDLLNRAGLLERTDGSYQSPYLLLNCEDILIFSDPPRRGAEQDEDLVLWPNPTTRTLWRFTVRGGFHRVLDLGTGNGFQALAASPHARAVVATDLNPRASEFAVFNAWLNGAGNVEVRTGDLFAPVVGEKFNLIVSNPPFFIAPRRERLYCDNEMDLDLFCRRLVKEAPQYLEEGGVLQMVCEWAEVEGQDWHARLAEWFDGTGCDAWVLLGASTEASSYGFQRFCEVSRVSKSPDPHVLAEWLEYYRAHHVESIHGGFVMMRKRKSDANWLRIETLNLKPTMEFGGIMLELFRCQDLLAECADDNMLAQRTFRLSPRARLAAAFEPAGSGWRRTASELRLEGIGLLMSVDPQVAEFLALFDGSRDAGEVVDSYARRVPADPAIVRKECLAAVRKCLSRSFLEVAQPPQTSASEAAAPPGARPD
jgi:SAM-dependent methyltransferase